ncbi:hypothetical protein C8J57DRAFT_1721481 [Mycena rebaudengoi]|nr:hypothetical protein C8J57DRAFT_1721481 [Mycena rebaudengoi]
MPPPTRLAEASATARQWCTICQTNPRMSVYQPIAVSAFEICVAVGSSTDTKLMKLALYAVDETALLLNSSQVGLVPPEFLALLEAYERHGTHFEILDNIRRHIENAQISTNKRGNIFSRHITSSRLKNELKNQLKTMLHGSQLALPTLRENTVEILSVSLRASAVICEAPPLNFLKPIVGLAALICETAKTAKSNRDAAEELAKRAINVTNCVVERAWKTEIFLDANEDALNGLKGILEDVHSYLIFLNKRRRAMSWMLATQEKDRVAQLNAVLDRALSLFTTTCVLSSNECLRSSNELVRSNTIQLDVLGSTVKQLDGEMSQNFAALHLQLSRSAGSEKAAWAVAPLGSTNTSKLFYFSTTTLKPPDGVALAEAYTRLESESDGADGKEALERFVEARTALVAEAERDLTDTDIIFNLSHWRCPCFVAKQLIAAGHAPADVTEGSYSIMESPYLPPRSVRFPSRFFITSSFFAFSVKIRSSPHPRRSLAAPPPARSFPPSYPPLSILRFTFRFRFPPSFLPSSARVSPRLATTEPSHTSSPSCTPRTPPAWCVGVLAAGVHAAGVALVDDELAEELAGGGADAEVDVGEARAQEQHVARRSGEHERPGALEQADPARGGACGDADADAGGAGGADADARAAGADDVLRLNLATSAFTASGRENRLHYARAAAVLVRLARRRWMGWTRGMCAGGAGGHEGAEGADVAGGRAACGGGGEGCGGGACGGRARRERKCTVAVHKDKVWVCTHTHKIPRPVQDKHFMSFPGAAVRGGARRGVSVRALRGRRAAVLDGRS